MSWVARAVTVWLAMPLAAEAALPFLYEKDQVQQCATLKEWVEGIQARAPSIDLYHLDMQHVRALAASSFRDDVFATAFGRSYPKLSTDDRRRIHAGFSSCLSDHGWHQVLMQAFELEEVPVAYRNQWARVIAAARAGEAVAPSPAELREALRRPARLASVEVPINDLTIRPCPSATNFPQGDRFFSTFVYQAIEGGDEFSPEGLLRGSVVACGLQRLMLTLADVQALALELLRQRLKEQRIEESDLTRAMTEGRFNPHWEDIVLAWRGLARLDPRDLAPEWTKMLQAEKGWAADGTPRRDIIEPLIRLQRRQMWESRFGSLASLPGNDVFAELFAALERGSAADPAALEVYGRLRKEGQYGKRLSVSDAEGE